jgi:hypothetical protein
MRDAQRAGQVCCRHIYHHNQVRLTPSSGFNTASHSFQSVEGNGVNVQGRAPDPSFFSTTRCKDDGHTILQSFIEFAELLLALIENVAVEVAAVSPPSIMPQVQWLEHPLGFSQAGEEAIGNQSRLSEKPG